MDTTDSATERTPANGGERPPKSVATNPNAAYQAVLQRAEQAEAELARVRMQLEAYQQELFESERQGAWLSAERQALVGQVAHLEARPRHGEPITDIQSRLAELENAAALGASYARSLETWISRAEERATKAEAELNELRAARR
jgi:chromosome segregation ATPase